MRRLILSVILTGCLFGIALGQEKLDLSKYQLQDDRIGPVYIGATPREASAKLGIPVEPDVSPGEEQESCYYASPKGYSEDVGFMIEDGRITRIDIISRNIPSAKGIHIGDSEKAVKKAFPGQVKEERHPYLDEDGKYLIVKTKPGFGFIFETMRGKITTFRSGRLSSIRYIEGCL